MNPRPTEEFAAKVTEQRAAVHGHPFHNGEQTGKAWAALLSEYLRIDVPALPSFLCHLMMVVFKAGRAARPFPRDLQEDYGDLLNYAKFAEEAREAWENQHADTAGMRAARGRQEGPLSAYMHNNMEYVRAESHQAYRQGQSTAMQLDPDAEQVDPRMGYPASELTPVPWPADPVDETYPDVAVPEQLPDWAFDCLVAVRDLIVSHRHCRVKLAGRDQATGEAALRFILERMLDKAPSEFLTPIHETEKAKGKKR